MQCHIARAVLLSLAPLAGAVTADATEMPEYQLLEKDGAFELRQYPAMLVAETLVTGTDFDDAGDVAFSRLFQYITGNNRARTEIAMTAPVVQTRNRADNQGEKIAMTAPVLQQPGDAGGYRIAFIVPAEYTRATVPQPLDPNVRIVEMPSRLVAARRYAGRTSAELHRRQETALREEIGKRQLAVAGEPGLAQYDAPFVPGALRRNEVLIPVTRKPATPAGGREPDPR
jgi:SOUL heme-binding protein